MPLTRFAKFAWFVLLYNLAAVAWGVFVRASKSGDGCGRSWPLCDGQSIPMSGPVAKLVEGSHRLTTGLIGVFAIVLVVWAYRSFPKKHLARIGSVGVLVMTCVEGLIGAALVKFGWVTTNDSAARAAVMAFHVLSTFLLLGFLVATVFAATTDRLPDFKGQKAIGWILGFAGFGLALLAVSGAVSALGHQLKPVDNVIQAALNPATHWMVRLQPLHPLIALSVGLYILLAGGLIQHLRPDDNVRKAVRWMVGIYGMQLGLGVMNIWFKAPIPMQMAHLVLADINWISVVVLTLYAMAEGIERVELRPAPADAEQVQLKGKALVKAYIALTKPRVISLLLFTTLTAAIAARGEWPGFILFSAVALGGYMAAGAANAINMVIDRDIDFTMKRTASRPTVTQAIPTPKALLFAFGLAIGSFAILWAGANLLSAVMAFSGLVFYVIVYTMLLKRRTWHNIVIGGAAGAFPPLVGWAAVTDSLPPLSLYLFAIIFVWTPVHFWALALLLKDEYAAAGVPMLPVVKGERHTVNQIAAYAVLTFAVTLAPFFLPEVGWIYAVTALVLNCILIYLCFQLYRRIDRPRASSLFHYSMLYLAILFLMFAVDRTVVINREGPANSKSISVKSPPFPTVHRQLGQRIVKVANHRSASRKRGPETASSSLLGAYVNGPGI
jgi:protoheme IX farnesyltransferase